MENQVIEKELESKALTLKDQATAMVVKDVASYASAGELGKNIKELRAKIVDYFQPLKEAAHKAHKAITTKEAEELKPVDEAINILRKTMNDFNEEQKRLERLEQARLQKIADDAAAAEREKLLKQAIKAEEKGQSEKAEEKLEQAELVYSAPVTVAPTVQKTIATSAGNITQANDVKVSVLNLNLFLSELLKNNPGAVASLIDIKAGPLKIWAKSNGLEKYPGLNIERVSNVRF